MTRPRSTQISLSDTPYYHIVSRCVRRTFLCGFDKDAGKDYEHRRQWIVDRIRLLSSLFAVDICSYAVMSNHYHLVVRLDPAQADDWTFDEVMTRWTALYKGPLLAQRYQAKEPLSPVELTTLDEIVTVWRKRLAGLSWFMKYLNEPIARAANKEDECTGHFWEARFKSQPLLDEAALISCMAYVDLNPIRAQMADTPETSDYTSIQERITTQFDLCEAVKEQMQTGHLQHFEGVLKPLLDFTKGDPNQPGIPFTHDDYLMLVDWTGRAVRDDKRGAIPDHLPTILKRLQLNQKTWIAQATQFEQRYRWRRQRIRLADTG